jgi:hypothetical protein
MFKNPLLLSALTLTGAVAVWGIFDTPGLANFSSTVVGTMFTSRGWFIMLTASALLLVCIWLALSPYGRLKLGTTPPSLRSAHRIENKELRVEIDPRRIPRKLLEKPVTQQEEPDAWILRGSMRGSHCQHCVSLTTSSGLTSWHGISSAETPLSFVLAAKDAASGSKMAEPDASAMCRWWIGR